MAFLRVNGCLEKKLRTRSENVGLRYQLVIKKPEPYKDIEFDFFSSFFTTMGNYIFEFVEKYFFIIIKWRDIYNPDSRQFKL